jgi:hypothetical protein
MAKGAKNSRAEAAKKARRASHRTSVARKTAKTRPARLRALGERSRRGQLAKRKKANADQQRSFDSELFALLKDAPGTNLESIKTLTGFREERVRKLEEMGVVERSAEGGFRISERFMDEFRRENRKRRAKRAEELEMREYLMESEARHEVQKEQPAGVA